MPSQQEYDAPMNNSTRSSTTKERSSLGGSNRDLRSSLRNLLVDTGLEKEATNMKRRSSLRDMEVTDASAAAATLTAAPTATTTISAPPTLVDEELGQRPTPMETSAPSTTASTNGDENCAGGPKQNSKTEEESEEQAAARASSPPSLTRILQVARPEWPAIIVALLLSVASEGIGLINPLVIARAYNALVADFDDEDARMDQIHRAMLLVMVLHLSGVGAGFLRHAILGATGERLVARLRIQLYGAILKQDIAFFDEHKSGELVSRLGSDTTLLQGATSQSIPEFVLGIIKLVVSVSLMFWISFKLAGLTLGSVFLIFMIAVPFGMIIGKLSKSYQDELGAAQTRSTECLGAMRTVQSFAAEEREQERYRNKIGDPDEFPFWWPTKSKTTRLQHQLSNDNDDNSKLTKSAGSTTTTDSPSLDTNKTTYSVGFYKSLWNSGFFSFIFGFGFAAMYASLWYGFKLVSDGEISLGDLTAFESYIFQIGFGLAGTSGHLSKVLEALGASGRIFYLMDRVPSIPTPPSSTTSPSTDKGNKSDTTSQETSNNTTTTMEKQPQHITIMTPPQPPLKPESMEGAVTFENVSFSYPSRSNVPVLKNFSLTVAPNTTAALVGSSGAGKSTVVALLQRFYDVDSGSIQIDGNDIRSLDLSWLRQRIGYVQQEPSLFGLSVRENIAYGVTDREVTQEELEAVCQKANAHDFITKWPNGYDTLVGERGVKLSGGQKQRLGKKS